ncbi:MAG: hypothetical protein ACETVO_05485 [bacterium]
MEKVIKAPSRSHYVIGIVILIVSLVLFAILLRTPGKAVPSEIQIVVPGSRDLYLPEAGKYMIFYEYLSIIDDKTYSTGEQLSPMLAGLQSRQYYKIFELTTPSRIRRYEVGGRAGVSLFEFEIEFPGNYLFTAKYAGEVSGPDVVFAIGKVRTMGTTPAGLGKFFGTLIIGGFIIVRTFLKRRKTRKQKVSDIA